MRSMRARGEVYVDRGDPAAADFTDGAGIISDGVWRNLDLSAIVPVASAEHLVHLAIYIRAASTGRYITFREEGNANSWNAFNVGTQAVNVTRRSSGFVMMDDARVVEYLASNVVFALLAVVVRGWYVDIQ